MSIVFEDCDLSKSRHFISNAGQNGVKINIAITRTKSGGFSTGLGDLSVTFTDCTIDIGYITSHMENLAAKEVKFVNCVFIGKVEIDDTPWQVFGLDRPGTGSHEPDSCSISFVDCRFDLDSDWKTELVGDVAVDNPKKQFMMLNLGDAGTAHITFTRCWSSAGDVTLNLIKAVGTKDSMADRIRVTGDDVGFSVNMGWVDSYDDMYTERNTWHAVITSSGYKPSSEQPDTSSEPEQSPLSNNDKDTKTWRSVAIAFIVLFVVAAVAAVVIALVCRKKYDRSENEN